MEYSSPDQGLPTSIPISTPSQANHGDSGSSPVASSQGRPLLSSGDGAYSLLFDKRPQPMWIFDETTLRFLAVNQAAIRYYGYSHGEFMAMTLKDIRPPEDVPPLEEHFRQGTRSEYSGRWRHRKKDGSLIEVQVVSQALIFDGVPARLATISDQTEFQISELARRQAAAIARENLERFRAIFEQTGVGIVQSRIDGKFLLVNPGLSAMLGYAPEEIAEFSVWDILHPDDVELERQSRERILSGEADSLDLEKRYIGADGATRWVRAALSLTHNSTGEAISISEVAQNISARKKAEGELLVSEERFRLACDSAHLGVFDRDFFSDEVRASPEAERLFGFAPDSPRPTRRDWLLRIHPDDVARVTQDTQRATEENRDIAVEYRIVWPDGSTRWIVSTVHPVWEEGQPTRNVGILQDITVRKEAEIALRRSEERFRSLATTSAAIIITAAGNGVVYEELQGWQEYTEQAFEESRGYGWVQVVHPDDRESTLERWRQAVQEKQALENHFRLWHSPTKEYRHVVARGVPIFNDRGYVQEWIGTIFDIHESRERAAELERSKLLFERIAATTPGLLCVFDLATQKTVYVNDGIATILGCTPSQISEMGETILQKIIHPDDLPYLVQHLESHDSPSSTEIGDNEFRVLHADGGYRWLHSRDTVFTRDDAGKAEQILAIATDITAQKLIDEELARNTAELRRAEERYRSFIQQTTEGIWRFETREPVPIDLPVEEQLDRFYEVAFLAECNDAMARMYGFENGEQLIGAGPGQLMSRDDPHHIAYLKRIIANGYRAEDEESVEKDNNGNTRYFVNNLLGVIEDGKLVRAWGMQRDVTFQHEAEAALRENEAQLRIALDAAQMGTWTWEVGAKNARWNEQHFRLLGLDPAGSEPASFDTFERCLHPDDRSVLRRHIENALRGDAEDFQEEVRVIWPDGSLHWGVVLGRVIECIASENSEERLQPLCMSGVFYDITARKAAENALNQAHEALRNNALELEQRVRRRTAQLTSLNEQLQEEIDRRSKAEAARYQLMERLVVVQEEERRRISWELHDQMGQGLTALLMGLKSMPGSPDIGPVPTNSTASMQQLQQLTEELMEQVHRLAWELRPAVLDNIGLDAALHNYIQEWMRSSGIEAELLARGFRKAPRLPWYLETTLYRVVQEALTNIQRHARASRVDVIVERLADSVHVLIEDNGVGFDIQSLNLGAGVDSTEHPSAPRSRLGLLGMRERIELIRGTLEIESSPGAGTTLVVRTPLNKDTQTAPAEGNVALNGVSKATSQESTDQKTTDQTDAA